MIFLISVRTLDCSKKEKKRDVGVQKLSARSRDAVNTQTFLAESIFYYINNNDIPGELSRENLISSDVEITCYLHMRKYHRCYGYIINRAFHTKKLLRSVHTRRQVAATRRGDRSLHVYRSGD